MKPSQHRLIPNWLLLVCAIVLIIALSYLTWFVCVQPEPTAYIAPTAITSNSSTKGNTSNTNSATEDWKTYTNSTYGFSFKYPQNFTATVSTDKNFLGSSYSIGFHQTGEKGGLTIAIQDTDKTLDQVIFGMVETAKIPTIDYPNGVTATKTSPKIGNITGAKLVWAPSGDAGNCDIVFIKDGNLYDIKSDTREGYNIDTILSTFHFTQ